MSKIVSDPRLPVVKDEKIRPLTQRLYELFRQYAIAHNKSYMWDTEGTAAPTTGTWAVSQTCKNTSPIGTGALVIGWICTTSGTPGTWVSITGGVGRERLTSNRTYYVRTDGSDSNNGLANTSDGAFLTIQYAVDVVSSSLDIASGVVVTIQLADGTYTGSVSMRNLVGFGSLTIQGNSSTPGNVIVSVTNASCFNNKIGGMTLIVKNMKLQTTTSGSCFVARNSGLIEFSGIDFGSCATAHIDSQSYGIIRSTGNYTISGGAVNHVFVGTSGSVSIVSITVTLSGTPAFSLTFASSNLLGCILIYGVTFSGTGATGQRYYITQNSICYTNGAGATYFPGDVAGSTATGGQYL